MSLVAVPVSSGKRSAVNASAIPLAAKPQSRKEISAGHRFLLALLLTASPTVLAAQTANTTVQLDEVVVKNGRAGATATGPIDGYVPRVSATGTKTATPLIETPQSISVIGAEQIRDQNAQSVVQATRYSSGVLSQTFGNDNRNDFLLIRGLPAQQSGYFLDGMQLASPGFSTFRVEPFDLERIEVLKGPASVLYGGSNTGGILNMVSKRPTETPHASIELGIDNYGNKYSHFDVGGPVGTSNQWFYRVEGVARGGDTQTAYTQDGRLSIAPSLTYAPDAATSITVISSYQKDRTKGQNFLPYFGTVQNATFGKIPTNLFTSDPGYDTFQRNQALIGYSAEHKFNDVFTVRQNLRYSDLRITDRTLFGTGYDGSANGSNAELSRLNFETAPHLTEFSVDTQAEARFTTGPISHVALVGVDYKHFTLFDNQAFAFGSAFDLNLLQPIYAGATVPNPAGTLIHNTQNQVGVYAQEQAKLGNLTLVLSGRHDSLETTINNVLTPASSAQSNDGAFTGRVGLIYTTDQGIAPYATYATSFDPQLGTNTSTQTALLPQKGQLEEVGIKYQPIGSNLSFTGALFNIVQTNVPTTDPNFVLGEVQTGQERSRGFELEAQGSLTDGLKILAAYTGYQVTTTQNDITPSLVGKTPTGVPQNFGSLFLDYTMQETALRGLGAGAGTRYIGGSYASTDNTFGVPAVVLADTTIHYEREHWRTALNVTNVFDKTYVSTCSSTTACFYGERRKATFSVAYTW
ncbi:TonB-dependent siderophore receptor [Beijerinckia sp. L45]|uniref:TonB-dependent siderophore receptor n=1 Tax=Beijerinckia sp. L45 TaxID=1641855 RepID=UPI00131E4E35|nr:TonB-dependent siderophore receptor [Beijerinckia sp. L45]